MKQLNLTESTVLADRVFARTRACLTGYVKEWKISENLEIIRNLARVHSHRGTELSLDQIHNLIDGSYKMEGVDQDCIDDVVLMIAEAYNL